jgi:glycosyltransferase involved in cell wall biosynthesis
MRKPDAVVIVPAYNEEKTIGEVLSWLLPLGFPVVMVDDGSQDGTYSAAWACSTAGHLIYLLRHACNLGQGAAGI